MVANAHGAFDGDHAGAERIEAIGEVTAAESALAEGAFEGGVRLAVFNAAEACAVPLLDAEFVGDMILEVLVLGAAGLAGADGLVIGEESGVGGAEGPAAVLAGFGGQVGAAGKVATNLAALAWRHGTPRSTSR